MNIFLRLLSNSFFGQFELVNLKQDIKTISFPKLLVFLQGHNFKPLREQCVCFFLYGSKLPWAYTMYASYSIKMTEFIGGWSISNPITMIYNLLLYFVLTFLLHTKYVRTFCYMEFLHINIFFYFFREIHGCLFPSCLPWA